MVWGVACLLVGAAFLFNASLVYRERRRFLAGAAAAPATVVAVRVEGVGRNARAIPTFEFTDTGGRVRRAESRQPSGFTGAAVGRTVAIRYSPEGDAHADIDAFWPLWGLTVLRAGFGAIFALMGLVAIVISAVR